MMDPADRIKRASREAADWWAVLQGDDITRAEREGFVDWLRESKLHVTEMLRLTQVHELLGRFNDDDWGDISVEGPGDDEAVIALSTQSDAIPRSDGSDSWNGRIRLFAIAAAALVVVTVSFLALQGRGQSIATERGQRLEVVL